MGKPVAKKREFVTESGEVFPLCPVNEIDFAPYIKQLTHNEPKPPIELIDGVPVANEAHESYKEAMLAFNMQRGSLMMALYLELGLDLDLDVEQQAQVDRAKRKLERLNPGALENRFDLFLYAKSVCNTDEIGRLMEAIQNLNSPTAEAVQDALDTFRPDVPRPATNGHQDAPKWNRVPEWQPETDPLQSGDLGEDRNTALLRGNSPRVAG